VTGKIRIGRIFGAVGIKGEMKLFHDSGERERIAGIEELFFLRGEFGGQMPAGATPGREGPGGALCRDEEGASGFLRVKVLSMRYSGKTPILRLEGIGTREAAEGFVGAGVYAEKGALAPLGDGGYYVEEITGFSVVDEGGAELGEVSGVLENPAHDILRIAPAAARGGGELLLPMVDAFVRAVDMDAGKITVSPPDGLMDGRGHSDAD
jgi:16S rRNA processing protein RimM